MSGSELSAFDVAAILVLLAAVLGYVNHRVLRLPTTVGMTLMGAVASLCIVAIGLIMPASGVDILVEKFLENIDFHKTLMEGMLSFLLFAGALHVSWSEMRAGRWAILLLSTAGVLISTVLIGFGFAGLSSLLCNPVPLAWCLVFGALISPTDPVAVMAILRRAAVPPALQATVAGESLFNDGVGVVVFSILVAVAMGDGGFSMRAAANDFVREAIGGALFGAAIGWIAFQAMKSIDEYTVEVMISLATVMAGYSFAHFLHVSGPVAMAVAGLLIGNAGVAHAMSQVTRDYLIKFWDLIDEILNAVLFLLIGLEVILLSHEPRLMMAGLFSIPLVLLARAASVAAPLVLVRRSINLGLLTIPTLVWGGLRGGISIALALSLPNGDFRSLILATTFVIVLFAVVVQGGTIGALIGKLSARAAQQEG